MAQEINRINEFNRLSEEALKLGIVLTDYVLLDDIKSDYPHLDDDQAAAVLASISIGDYDDAIDRDIRRSVLDDAVKTAGFDLDDDTTPHDVAYNP